MRNTNTISTTVRLNPKTVSTLIEGLKKLVPTHGRYRTTAEVIRTSCEVLSQMLEQRFSELRNLSDSERAAIILSTNALDNHTVVAAATKLLENLPETEKVSIIPDVDIDSLCEESFRVSTEPSQKGKLEVPKNFLGGM